MSTQDIQTKARKLVQQDGLSYKEAARRLGCAKTTVYNAVNGRSDKKASGARPRAGAVRGATMQDFRDRHDIRHRIRTAVAEHLPDGGERYYTDDEFRRLCGVNTNVWRRNADIDEFESWHYRRGEVHIWAPTDMLEEMKEILGVV